MLTIRRASPEDAAAIAALRCSWQGGQIDAAFTAEMDEWLATTAAVRTTWLAYDDEHPVGMVSVSRYERMPRPGRSAGAWGYLGQLYVVEAHRGAGLGRRLVDQVMEHSRAEGWSRVVLSPSELSKPLYARAGFDPAGDRIVVRGSFGA